MKKILIAILAAVLLSGCSLAPTSQLNKPSENLNPEKKPEATDQQNQATTVDYNNILASWRLTAIKDNIERYEIKKDDYSKEGIPYKTLFFRNDKYSIMNDNTHGFRKGNSNGQWEIITDKNILKIFMDDGGFLQYKIISLTADTLEIEKVTGEEISGNNVFPKTPGSNPEWKTYSDGKITFQYPKTFYGTNWQEYWENVKPAGEWNIEKQYNNILILPDGNSLASEYIVDIISYIKESEFKSAIKNPKAKKEESIKSDYEIYVIREASENSNYYYISDKKGNYIKISNYFQNQYHKYTRYLLESLKIKTNK